MRSFAVAFLGLAVAGPANAQTTGTALRKDEFVSVRIPPAAFQKVRSAFRTWVADVTLSDSAVTVNRNAEWPGIGFASPTPLRIADLKIDARKGVLQVRLDRQHEGANRLQRDRLFVYVPLADTAATLPLLFAPPADSGAVRAESYATVGRRAFGDARDSMPSQVQDGILGLADSLARGDTVRVVTFRDGPYLQLRAIDSDDNVVYNALLINEARQVAGVLDGAILPVVRILTGIVRTLSGSGYTLPGSPGYCIVAPVKSQVPSGLFMQYPGVEKRADLALYVSGVAVSRYAVAELTSQELVDQSVVMFKGKQIAVRLPE